MITANHMLAVSDAYCHQAFGRSSPRATFFYCLASPYMIFVMHVGTNLLTGVLPALVFDGLALLAHMT
jgi:hypothetical protein